MNNSTQPI